MKVNTERILRFCLGVIMLCGLYFFLLPWLASYIPSHYRENMIDQNIDATPLFYTESDEALKSYYLLRLSRINDH